MTSDEKNLQSLTGGAGIRRIEEGAKPIVSSNRPKVGPSGSAGGSQADSRGSGPKESS